MMSAAISEEESAVFQTRRLYTFPSKYRALVPAANRPIHSELMELSKSFAVEAIVFDKVPSMYTCCADALRTYVRAYLTPVDRLEAV